MNRLPKIQIYRAANSFSDSAQNLIDDSPKDLDWFHPFLCKCSSVY